MNKRLQALMPDGTPKYIRCYDNGGRSMDRYTVVYTGKYRTLGVKRERGHLSPRVLGNFQYVSMSEAPFHPQGVGMHGEYERQIDVNKWGFAPTFGRKNHLGTRIHFESLPTDCRKLVIQDYKAIWGL